MQAQKFSGGRFTPKPEMQEKVCAEYKRASIGVRVDSEENGEKSFLRC